MKKIITSELAPAAIGPYSQGVISGNIAFISGQLPINPKTGEIEHQNIKDQTKQSLENVKAILENEGFTLEDVVKTTCFITNMEDFADVNTVYSDYFKENCPARSCVAVKELPKKASFELEVIACK